MAVHVSVIELTKPEYAYLLLNLDHGNPRLQISVNMTDAPASSASRLLFCTAKNHVSLPNMEIMEVIKGPGAI